MPRRALRSSPTRYATDLTDEQWAAIAPLVTAPSPNGGRPTDSDRRAIVHALRAPIARAVNGACVQKMFRR